MRDKIEIAFSVDLWHCGYCSETRRNPDDMWKHINDEHEVWLSTEKNAHHIYGVTKE